MQVRGHQREGTCCRWPHSVMWGWGRGGDDPRRPRATRPFVATFRKGWGFVERCSHVTTASGHGATVPRTCPAALCGWHTARTPKALRRTHLHALALQDSHCLAQPRQSPGHRAEEVELVAVIHPQVRVCGPQQRAVHAAVPAPDARQPPQRRVGPGLRVVELTVEGMHLHRREADAARRTRVRPQGCIRRGGGGSRTQQIVYQRLPKSILSFVKPHQPPTVVVFVSGLFQLHPTAQGMAGGDATPTMTSRWQLL